MHQSRKESVVLLPEHRLLGNDVHESVSMQDGGFTAEAAQEWAGGTAGKPGPRKPYK